MNNVIYVNFRNKIIKNKKNDKENNEIFNSYINNNNIKKTRDENNKNIIKELKLEKEIDKLFNTIFNDDK